MRSRLLHADGLISRVLSLAVMLIVAALLVAAPLAVAAVAQQTDEQKTASKTEDKKEASDKQDKDQEQNDAEQKGDDQQDDSDEDQVKATEEGKAEVRNVFQQLGGMIQDAVEEAVDVADGDEPFEDEHFNGGITLDINRDLKRSFDLAQRQIEQGKITETVKELGELLTETDTKDFFMAPTSRGRMRQSFRASVQQLIGSLPPQGREAYEMLFGARARKLLEQSVADRDWNTVSDVVRRYYHTEAGAQALYLLGSHYLDVDRPREALVCLERLREFENADSFEPRLSALIAASRYKAGDIAAAVEDVAKLRDDNQEALALLTASGSSAPNAVSQNTDQLDSPEAIEAWLAATLGVPSAGSRNLATDWTTFRGDASRNVTANAQAPLLSSQLQQEIGSSYAIASLEAYRKAMNDAQLAIIPALHPVIVGDNALLSTNTGLRVRNLKTGESWGYPRSNSDSTIDDNFWCGSAYGLPATNGQLAFVVEGQAQATGQVDSQQMEIMMMRQMRFRGGWGGPAFINSSTGSVGGHLTNSLTAVDLGSKGKRRWQVGGADGGDDPLLAGAYFLGSPQAYGGRVYAIAEFQGSLRLLGLNAETGTLEWNQELAIAESAIAADTYRQMAGATPSIADGMIVCPTSCGGVVALDLITQTLAWAYRYPRRNETITSQDYYYRGNTPLSLNQGNRWVDGTALIADGCVLVTPLESDEVHCLDLRTGELLWKKPRGNDQTNLFVACVDDGNCIMVGRERVIAWNLLDGEATWSEPLQLPENVFPSGQGVHLPGGRYLLPLSNATLAHIDLSTGQITDTQTTRREMPLGNLVFANGQYFSLGPKFIETFPQREPLQASSQAALAEDANDAEALTHQGELAQMDGVFDEAIAHYQKAYELEPTPRRKNLLVAALLTGVRQQLPQAAEYDELLKALAPE